MAATGPVTTAYAQIEQWQARLRQFETNPFAWSDWDGYSSPSDELGGGAAGASGGAAALASDGNGENGSSGLNVYA